MKILYLLQQFPKISSEAFILNEMIELQNLGHDVWVLADVINYLKKYELHELIVKNNFMEKVITGDVYTRGTEKLLDFLKKITFDLISQPKMTLKNFYFVLLNNPYYKNKNIWSKLDNYLILRKLPTLDFDLVYSPFGHLEKIDKGMAIANIINVPFVAAFRALELYGNKCQAEIIKYKKIFAKIPQVVTISKFNKQKLEELSDSHKEIEIIHSSIDPEKFSPLTIKAKKDKVSLITVARFVEKKGINYLLEALAILKNDGLEFEYTLIGDGPMINFYNFKIKELGIDQVVKILPPMPQETIKIAIGNADIMILPCIVAENGDRDIMANVLKEAMSMEIPVITSDISGIEELITNRKNGLLVPEKDVASLVISIKELINNPGLRETIGKEGRKKIVEDFNVKKEAKKLSNFFSEIIKKQSKKNLHSKKSKKKEAIETTATALGKIKSHGDGLLNFNVYPKIYKYAYRCQPGNMLELGSAHGAASICLIKGMLDSGKKDKLITVERGEGKNSSMTKFGSKEININILKNNLKYFNCDKNVLVIAGKIREKAKETEKYSPFSLLLIDADGVIDRDFLLFYNLLKPGATIIIDDYQKIIERGLKNKTNPLGKKYSTYCFVNYFLQQGLIEKKEIIDNTIFCCKPKKINYTVTFNLEDLSQIRNNLNQEAEKLNCLFHE